MTSPSLLTMPGTDSAAIVQWLRSHMPPHGNLQLDSRRVQPGDAFIAWPGAATDGRRFVAAARAAGAACAVVEAEALGHEVVQSAAGWPLLAVPQLKAACGPVAARWHHQPSQRLKLFAITGTNGKTSTAWWLAQAYRAALQNKEHATQSRCAVAGTLGIGDPWYGAPHAAPEHWLDTGLTTPEPITLQHALAALVERGYAACAIEASSIGLAEHRLDGCLIAVAVFTNFTQDHLDYHGSMDAYWQAKARLFDWAGLGVAVVNIDDSHGAALAQQLGQRAELQVWTCSLHRPARLRVAPDSWQATTDGQRCIVREEDRQQAVLHVPVIGAYNLANVLGVVAVLRSQGVALQAACDACAHLRPVPGRLEPAHAPSAAPQPLVLVDYAHTPDALQQVLGTLRPVAQARGGLLWCVLGCGGNRDATKRPLMAAVAERSADRVLVTSDNPRDEKPEAIVAQMLLGLSHRDAVQVQVDRARAIAQVCADAADADVVLIAGKGHERYQEVAGVRHPFADAEHAVTALIERLRRRGVALEAQQ
jgi:UDP-N-acetylmuramyl-tripeptide synthetase